MDPETWPQHQTMFIYANGQKTRRAKEFPGREVPLGHGDPILTGANPWKTCIPFLHNPPQTARRWASRRMWDQKLILGI